MSTRNRQERATDWPGQLRSAFEAGGARSVERHRVRSPALLLHPPGRRKAPPPAAAARQAVAPPVGQAGHDMQQVVACSLAAWPPWGHSDCGTHETALVVAVVLGMPICQAHSQLHSNLAHLLGEVRPNPLDCRRVRHGGAPCCSPRRRCRGRRRRQRRGGARAGGDDVRGVGGEEVAGEGGVAVCVAVATACGRAGRDGAGRGGAAGLWCIGSGEALLGFLSHPSPAGRRLRGPWDAAATRGWTARGRAHRAPRWCGTRCPSPAPCCRGRPPQCAPAWPRRRRAAARRRQRPRQSSRGTTCQVTFVFTRGSEHLRGTGSPAWPNLARINAGLCAVHVPPTLYAKCAPGSSKPRPARLIAAHRDTPMASRPRRRVIAG